ncbi:DNA alkylation repair protein [Pseudarthrobacter sp. AB1]|uniref:DNA alkylation repair protein n=1 Tax=Pseudarthrobacter sp. AB1 TaxID=2138309 RepID=UPI002814ACAF|nr:DNA alkylation repair protein [Pseudarthrobacter sp. AB1]
MDGSSPHEETLGKDPSDMEARATETPNRALLDTVRAALRELTDPERAAGAQAYTVIGRQGPGGQAPGEGRCRRPSLYLGGRAEGNGAGAVARLHGARGRYAAIDLTGLRLVARDQLMLPVYEEIIRTGKWWDFVDGVSDRIGGLLQAHRPMMTELLLAWSTDQDFWIRRSAITSQLWVCNFVMIKGTQLSPLSRQEAMRHLEEGTTPGVTGSG